jgi:hypothetical protein
MLATANNIDFSLKKDEDKKEDYNSIENDEWKKSWNFHPGWKKNNELEKEKTKNPKRVSASKKGAEAKRIKAEL